MKDKRNYLKIGGIIGVLYSVFLIIKVLFIDKDHSNDYVIANVFLNVINIVFSILMIKESLKDINTLKLKKGLVIISSIWLFIETIIPGIFGFMFLSSLNEKKKLELPTIKEKPKTAKDYIKYALLIVFFICFMFIIPAFVELKFSYTIIIYVLIFTVTILLTHNDLKENFIVFKDNKKTYFKFIIKRYLYMLLALLVASVPIMLFKNSEQSVNQQMLNQMISKKPLFIFILTVFYAPFVEEIIFRFSFKKLINNKMIFIIISGVLFGLAHVIGDFKDISDILYVIQYSALGICLSKAYYDSKNIFTSILMHFTQNFLASILMLLLTFLK